MKLHISAFILILILIPSAFAQKQLDFEIDGVKRFAIVHEGEAKKKKSPVVLVFHGHGGNARNAERRLNFHDQWKEALVVYLQGIPGASGITDAAGERNGWQKNPGELGDRDLKFVDELIKKLIKDYKVDEDRIYAAGHSNGSRFVNVLWETRADKFAAFCAVAGPGGLMIRDATPRSIWISMGKKDPIVPFAGQQRSADFVKQMLNVDEKKAKTDGDITTYEGANKTELVVEIRDAGHEFPVDSIPKIVEFFKRHKRQNRER